MSYQLPAANYRQGRTGYGLRATDYDPRQGKSA